MTLIQAQRSAVYMASGAALASVVVSGEFSLPVSLALVSAYVLSYFVGQRTAGRGTFLWNSSVLIVMVYLGVCVFTGMMDIVLAASAFAVFLLINRLFNRGTTRDYAALHLTMLLTISGGAALSAELSFGVAFVVFAVAITWSLTLTLLRGEIEEEARANQIADGGLSILQSRRLASPQFLLALGGLALAALAVAAMVFVAFPRVSANLLQRVHHDENRTGFSTAVDLGGKGVLKDDPKVAFRVFFAPGRKAPGSVLDTYWRGATMDQYDGHGWNDTVAPPRTALGQGRYQFPVAHNPKAEELTIELVPDASNAALFTTGRVEVLAFLHRAGMSREPPTLMTDVQGDLSYRPAQSQEFRYLLRTTLEKPPELRGLGRDYPAGFDRERYVQLPRNLDPRILELGKRLAGGKDPADAARSVEQYLSTYLYSTEITAGGTDPLASFLFDVKKGHCEYFATALAVLLRAGGVPSRVVTGFYGGSHISNGDYYVLREGDAHAWVEVYFPGHDWVAFDATPVASRAAQVGDLYGAITLWIDGVRMQWRSSIVDYDLQSQMRGLRSILEIANDASRRLSSGARTGRLQLAGRLILIVGLLVAAAIATLFMLRRQWRRGGRAAVLPRSEAQRRAGAVYGELTRRLVRHGITRRPSQTPRELLGEVRARNLSQTPIVERVVERYLTTRFGQQPLEVAELKELRREVRKV